MIRQENTECGNLLEIPMLLGGYVKTHGSRNYPMTDTLFSIPPEPVNSVMSMCHLSFSV